MGNTLHVLIHLTDGMAKHDPALVSRLYHSMLLIRRVEEHICTVYHTDAIKSPVHLSIGQESVATGLCDPLEHTDMVSNTYRCHATYIAKGGDLNQMMAELYGKSGGCAGGKAGSMHLVDIQNGVMGASAVVGTTIPVATGYALACKRETKMSELRRIVACVFGDGATEEGCFAESLNFAALHKLPVLYVCENNGLAIHSTLSQRWATNRLRDRVASYGIPTYYIGDGDVFALRELVMEVTADLRAGSGPAFIECKTYRWMEHVGPTDDHGAGYRDEKEFARWKADDQIARLETMLPQGDVTRIQAAVEQQLKDTVAFAEASPYPPSEALYANVYA